MELPGKKFIIHKKLFLEMFMVNRIYIRNEV